MLSCLCCLVVLSSPKFNEAHQTRVNHLGTFEKQTTFTLSSKTDVLPQFSFEVVNDEGRWDEHYLTGKTMTITNTYEGATLKKAVLKGETIKGYTIEWSQGKYHNDKGELVSWVSDEHRYIEEMIRALPNHTYTLSGNNKYKNICFYDENGVFIRKFSSGSVVGDGDSTEDITVQAPTNAKYMRFNMATYHQTEDEEHFIVYDNTLNHVWASTDPYESFPELSVEKPVLAIANWNGTQSNILTLEDEVVLRSKGNVYDELDLLTGEFTQRISETGEILSEAITQSLKIDYTYQFPRLEKSFLQIEGEIKPLLTSITVPSKSLTFTLDPNQEAGQQFIAPEFEVTNGSNAPLKLTLKTFEQTSDMFNDVLPSKYSSWDDLTKEQSKDIALGLVTKPSTDWLSMVNEPHYVSETDNKLLGTIKPKRTVGFEFVAHHGQAFNETLNPSYRLTFIFDLLQ